MEKKVLIFGIVFFLMQQLSAQNDSIYVDNNYLEDQIYLGVTYNVLRKRPENFTQNGLSGGLSLGFIKDIPLNERRNRTIGIGLGYAYNAYIQNLKITETSGITTYEVVDNISYKYNRFLSHTIEVPIEFRWRTSTSKKYRFWRIYGGAKVGYVFSNRSKYSGDLGLEKIKNINEFEKIQYGLTLSVGYNTLNLHMYYGLNPLFKNAVTNGENIDIKQFNIGLMFYIL